MKNKIKTIILGIVVAAVAVLGTGGCDTTQAKISSNKMYSEWRTNYFNKAIINIHKEIIEVDVKEWMDYEDSDAIIIVTTDGAIYYTHLRDCTLISQNR